MMDSNVFPSYIIRPSVQEQIERLAENVLETGQSQVALLQGAAGVGKTCLVRHIQEQNKAPTHIWLTPIDTDDPEYWSLNNLEYRIYKELNDHGAFFPRFDEAIRDTTAPHQFDRIMVQSHLRRISTVFLHDYETYVKKEQKVIVITLDTIEYVRESDDMILKLIHWMKDLPRTLFILSGRPPIEENSDDPLESPLRGEYRSLPLQKIYLNGFSEQETFSYLEQCGLFDSLDSESMRKAALLTQGHPLWLALTLNYWDNLGIPDEYENYDLQLLKRELPYQKEKTDKGRQIYDEYIRRLLIPYSETTFWYESIKRLGVVRQRLNQSMWQRLMEDLRLPNGIPDWETAWDELLKFPWIRTSAGGQFISLHDALAEELARRVIPLHDHDRSWRTDQWRRIHKIYSDDVATVSQSIFEQREKLSDALEVQFQGITRWSTSENLLNQLKAARFYYEMLLDYETGCRAFIKLFDEASDTNNFNLRELAWLTMQYFLAAPTHLHASSVKDVVFPDAAKFYDWYQNHPAIRYEIGYRSSNYLLESGYPEATVKRVTELLETVSEDFAQKYQLYRLRANAQMWIPNRFSAAEDDFEAALRCTENPQAPKDVQVLRGDALKELGYFYRQAGDLSRASEKYRQASQITPMDESQTHAAILTNHAYVQALQGRYQEAFDMCEAALSIRRDLNNDKAVGMTLSTLGEVNRYWRHYQAAWDAYAEAESIFSNLGEWAWMGQIRQQQAICLFQAYEGKVSIAGFEEKTLLHQAEIRAIEALDLCEKHNFRAFPSALNRASRILRHTLGIEKGIELMSKGVEVARYTDDKWFSFANAVELAELRYQVWSDAGYDPNSSQIQLVFAEMEKLGDSRTHRYFDLEGRRRLLMGRIQLQVALQQGIENNNYLLDAALKNYTEGFPKIVRGFFASHGATKLKSEFSSFLTEIEQLPHSVKLAWLEELYDAWRDPESSLFDEKPRQGSALLAMVLSAYSHALTHPKKSGEFV